MEALSAGLPVVASDISGPREQVQDTRTGLLVPPRDVPALAAALRLLAGNQALRTRLGRAGRERALLRYDEARVVAHTLDLLGL